MYRVFRQSAQGWELVTTLDDLPDDFAYTAGQQIERTNDDGTVSIVYSRTLDGIDQAPIAPTPPDTPAVDVGPLLDAINGAASLAKLKAATAEAIQALVP